MQTMDKFSHDLSRALEETSKCVKVGRWGRRRTLSTGNLPCAPQPTEDSSSSPTDAPNEPHSNHNPDGLNSIHSDSDDRHDLRLSFQTKSRHVGNIESDSLNENFSPARPNTRRKRKFKKMAVEYETTPTTPGASCIENIADTATETRISFTNEIESPNNLQSNGNSGNSGGAIKKRVLKCPDNYRTNLFFCGKRKRSHRDRYHDQHDYLGGKQHSSSVPRQSYIYPQKTTSFAEHKQRTRSFSSATKPNLDKILPLNKCLISKIEKISQQNQDIPPEEEKSESAYTFKPIAPEGFATDLLLETLPLLSKMELKFETQILPPRASNPAIPTAATNIHLSQIPENVALVTDQVPKDHTKSLQKSNRRKKNHRLRREQIRAQLQFDDPHSMECTTATTLNDFLSSSSLSSSDSEADETNESDREGDDELTDWPGNEAMINFASKNDFKRRINKKMPQIKSDEFGDDTLMSGDEILSPQIQLKSSALGQVIQTQPIDISSGFNTNTPTFVSGSGGGPFANNENPGSAFRFPAKQIESEMSGETSNPFLASPPCQMGEIREIRAGCRRIKDERPGFCIKTSVNERLARFLQDARQNCIRLPDMEINEHDALVNLAKLYSLHLVVDNVGCAVLTKTSNTTQSVKVDHHKFNSRFFLSDFKRRCYDGRSGSFGSCSQETADSLIDSITNDYNDSDTLGSSHLPTTPTSVNQNMTS